MAEQTTQLNKPSLPGKMSIAEFHLRQERDIQNLSEVFLNQLCHELVEELTAIGYGYLLGRHGNKYEDAKDLICSDRKMRANAAPTGDKEKHPTTIINKFRQMYASVIKESFLLIGAPKSTKDDVELPMTWKEESHMRAREFVNFCKVFPGLKDQRHEVKSVEVTSREELFGEVFLFQEECKNRPILIKHIIFNGHGSEEGLEVGNDKGDCYVVNLNEFLGHVAKLEGSKMKHITQVVFAQCYGHNYTDPENEKIIVRSLSKENNPDTFSAEVGETEDGLPDWEHIELMDYAREESVEEENQIACLSGKMTDTSITN